MIKQMVLIAKRKDGLYLRLDKSPGTTTYNFINDACFAEHINPCNNKDLLKPQEASYYFENSYRARKIWLKDCVMVPFEITTIAREVK